jgi:hypothetical protein
MIGSLINRLHSLGGRAVSAAPGGIGKVVGKIANLGGVLTNFSSKRLNMEKVSKAASWAVNNQATMGAISGGLSGYVSSGFSFGGALFGAASGATVGSIYGKGKAGGKAWTTAHQKNAQRHAMAIKRSLRNDPAAIKAIGSNMGKAGRLRAGMVAAAGIGIGSGIGWKMFSGAVERGSKISNFAAAAGNSFGSSGGIYGTTFSGMGNGTVTGF